MISQRLAGSLDPVPPGRPQAFGCDDPHPITPSDKMVVHLLNPACCEANSKTAARGIGHGCVAAQAEEQGANLRRR